jgi:DNA-binding CsgD family transcriptional regulator/PAS domain-containing protein
VPIVATPDCGEHEREAGERRREGVGDAGHGAPSSVVGGAVNVNASDALLGALTPLHEAPQDTGAWFQALHALTRAIPCEQGALVERLGAEPQEELGLVVGTDARFLAEYQREFHRVDPFASDVVRTRLHDLGRAALSAEVLQDIDLQRSVYYQQFLSRYGDLFHGVGGSFPISEDAHAHIWLLRPRGRAFEEAERVRMDMFLGHARAALRQRRWLMRMERERDAALAWMDCWNDATFVLDSQGSVVIANLMAERLLHGGEVFTLVNGKLRPARPHEPDWIGPNLQALTKLARSNGGEATRCLAVPGGAGGAPLHAVFTCLPRAPGRDSGSGAQFALILRDLSLSVPRFRAEQLRDLFGFTAAEARVANALLVGQTVEDISRETDVRCDTVRSHVKRMLAKTGTRRQGDLQKLLVMALPNVRGLQDGDED